MVETTVPSRFQLALLAFGFAPLLLVFFANLWDRPYYQFFPSALAGAWFLAWCRVKELPRPFEPGQDKVGAALMGGSFLILLASVLLYSPWLTTFAAELGLAGVAWWMGGKPLLRAMVPALVLLLTIIPPPLSEDDHLMRYLRALAVRWSGQVLDALGVFHFLNGNVIELPRAQLLVEEACSGINSVLFASAACLFYLMWRRRPVWRMVVCLPCVVAGVLLGNVFRITLGAWLSYHQIIDILSGWKHELTGLVLVGLYLALIVSLDELIDFLLLPIREKDEVPVPAAIPRPPAPARFPSRSAFRWGLTAACLFAILGVAEVGLAVQRHYREKRAWTFANRSALPAGAVFTMPEQIGDWKRLDVGVTGTNVETEGIFSKIWHYQRGPVVAHVAFDYPIRGYHDVTFCYRGNGWNITRQTEQTGLGTNRQPLMEVEMEREPVSEALLWFSTVDEQGRWMEMPAAERTLLGRWKLSGQPDAYGTTSYRMQVLLTGYGPVPAEARAPARQLFENARAILAQELFQQLPPRP